MFKPIQLTFIAKQKWLSSVHGQTLTYSFETDPATLCFQSTNTSTWVCIHQPFSRTFLVFFFRLFLYLAAFECNTTFDWLTQWFNQSEVVLQLNLQILEKKTKNVLENGWWIRASGPYSSTILKNILYLVLQVCLHLKAFGSNRT